MNKSCDRLESINLENLTPLIRKLLSTSSCYDDICTAIVQAAKANNDPLILELAHRLANLEE